MEDNARNRRIIIARLILAAIIIVALIYLVVWAVFLRDDKPTSQTAGRSTNSARQAEREKSLASGGNRINTEESDRSPAPASSGRSTPRPNADSGKQPGAVTNNDLPNSGPGEVIGLFALVAIAGFAAKQRQLRRD
jgi:hypothetical protein